MLFSKKKREVEESKVSKIQDKVANGIAGFLLSVQTKFASFMSKRINKQSNRSKQVCLAIFCLMFGGFSIYAFFGAFSDSEKSGKAIKHGQVTAPKYYDRTGSEFKESSINDKDIIRINRFKKHMDSLRRSIKGKPEYDSILKARPGLMDSINVIEEIYYSQSK